MGKQWKKSGKAAIAQKRGAQLSKIAKEIQVAARLGGPEPEFNPRLRMAVDAAKGASCPKETIDRAIKKGAGLLNEGNAIEEILYEGYGPHQVGILVECHTDNRARTASEIKNIFRKNEGLIGEMGSVIWQFNRICLIEGTHQGTIDPEEEAIEAGANEVETGTDNAYSFIGAPEDLDKIRTTLTNRGWQLTAAELSYQPKNITDLNDAEKTEVYSLLEALEEHDDTYRVYATLL